MSVIDTGTTSVIATIPVGHGLGGVAVRPDGREVYVSAAMDDAVVVIDGFSNRVVASIPVEAPLGVAVSPVGDRLYVVGTGLSVFDTATRGHQAAAAVGDAPERVAVSADGGHVYVTNRIKIAERRPCVISPIPLYCDIPVAILETAGFTVFLADVGAYLVGVAADPRVGRFYVANVWYGHPLPPGNEYGVLSIVDDRGHVLRRISLGIANSPVGVTSNADGSRAYLTVPRIDAVAIVDTTDGVVIDWVGVGRHPAGLSFTPDGAHLYVANAGDDTVSVVDTATNAVIATIPVGSAPYAMGQFIGPDIEFPTPTPTPTPPLGACVGDCDGDGRIAASELVTAVQIALGRLPVTRCRACDPNGDGAVGIEELVGAVDAAVRGCITE